MDITLNQIEARVLGALVEKQLTVPDYYPLTLNSLIAACNQKNNRNPEMLLNETDVSRATESLREKQLVWSVESAAARVTKYSHNMDKKLGLAPHQVAAACELILRGPQTVGELRTRCERLRGPATLPEMEAVLQSLETFPAGAIVVKLPREPGSRERRYAHLLCGPVDLPTAVASTATPTVNSEPSQLTVLQNEVKELRDQIEELRRQWAEFKKQFE